MEMVIGLFIFLMLVYNTLGEKECTIAEDCDLQGANCINFACVCPPSFVANSLYSICLPVLDGYGSSCLENVQCSKALKTGGICQDKICVCSKGYHYFLGRCWKSTGLGEECQHNENCFVSYDFEAATCTEKKQCACSPGYYQREYSSCRRESYKEGDDCGIASDCQYGGAICTKDRKCGNSNNLEQFINEYNDPTKFGLVRKSLDSSYHKVGDKCTQNDDCPKYADCSEAKVCKCKTGYFVNEDSCYPEMGSPCIDNTECIGKNRMCRNGTYCVCNQGFVTSKNNQYCDKMSRNIAWSCLRDEECGFFGPGGICVNKQCQCTETTHFVQEKLYCWVTKKEDEPCIEKEDCGGSESMCSGGKCQCSSGTHPSSDKSVCRQDSTSVDQPCMEKGDCLFENSFCNAKSQKCQCLAGYINHNGTCIPGVGGVCNEDNDCNADGSICVQGICKCKEDFIGSEDFSKCLPIENTINASCIESDQCAKLEGTCQNGLCSCLNGYHYVDGWHCFKTRYINQTCTSDGNCTFVKHSNCLNGICRCMEGHNTCDDGTTCSRGRHRSNDWAMPLSTTLFLFIWKQFHF